MRIGVALLLATAAFFLLATTASAASLVDDCTGLSLPYAQYSNFTLPAPGTEPGQLWPTPPDDGSLLVASPYQPASVVYTIQGAESVEISLYSRSGTFATQRADLKYTLGAQSLSMLEQPRYRTRFCPDGVIFLHISDQTMKLFRDGTNRLIFVDAACGHSHDEFIGANLYASADGSRFTPVQLSLKSVSAASSFSSIMHYYEQYAANLPAGTKYVKVTLRDFTAIDTTKGREPQQPVSRLQLARVSFTGAALLAGEQTPEPPPDGGSSSSGSSNGSSSTNSGSEQTTGGGSSTKREPTGRQKEEKPQSSSSSSSSTARQSSSTAAPRTSSGSKNAPEVSSAAAPGPEDWPSDEETVQAVVEVQAAPAPTQPKSGWKALMAAVYTLSAAGVAGRLLYKLF